MPGSRSPNPGSDRDLFVSVDGNDDWSGELEAPTENGDDGPFATIQRAQQAIRDRKQRARPIPDRVWIRGGRYHHETPLTFGPEDSAPVTYTAYPGERPVISGGRPIEGWEVESVHGQRAWKTTIPEVSDGEWYFRQLFVDGKRRPRSRLPTNGFFEVSGVPYDRDGLWNDEGGVSYTFRTEDAPLEEWKHLEDVDVTIPHRWVQERSPIATVDPASGTVEMDLYAKMWLSGGERVAFENVFEALAEPGEWYLDRATGECYYLPHPEESIESTTFIAPVTDGLLTIQGEAERPVSFLGFEGVRFSHSGWIHPAYLPKSRQHTVGHPLYLEDDAATAVQAQFVAPGAIDIQYAEHCRFENCAISHTGFYGLALGVGSRNNRVIGTDLSDLGAGGIKVEGVGVDEPPAGRTGGNRITDNRIQAGGRVFPAGVGILARQTFENVIANNLITDLYYSGISCGWSWGYGPCIDRDNHIVRNRIDQIGHGLLSDMGGIYTLGVQPGTTIKGNYITGVECADYGGWAIYPDEGSSHLVIENNVAHSTNRQVFHQHYGRENIVRNNLFGLGEEGQIALSRTDPEHRPGLTFEGNIVITNDQPVFVGGYGSDLDASELRSDLNLFYERGAGKPSIAMTHRESEEGQAISWERWEAGGNDRHSIVGDPGVADLEAGEITLPADSPARALGFEPIDLASVGPRK